MNQGGLERALHDKQRPGAALLGASEKQRIIAMVCSDPPAGRARWTVRLIAQEAVKRKLVLRAGRETIRVLLESHDFKPGRRRIPDLKTLQQETSSWKDRVNRDQVKINWTFDRKAARKNFDYKKNSSRRSET